MAKAKAPTASTSNAFQTLWKAYADNTPDRLKFIDAFLVFLMLSGIVQFLYCVLITNFPFNAFLAGYVILYNTVLDLLRVCADWRHHPFYVGHVPNH